MSQLISKRADREEAKRGWGGGRWRVKTAEASFCIEGLYLLQNNESHFDFAF